MSQNILQKAALLLSMLAVVAVGFGAKTILNKMDTIAAAQFGGKDNYEIAKKLFATDGFKDAQKKQLETALQQYTNSANNNNGAENQQQQNNNNAQAGDSANAFPSGKLTPDQLAAIKKDAYVEGDANAKVTIVEYSDPECPYCIRQHADKTVENAVAAFPGSVNHIFKFVQGVDHANTEYKSLAVLCAGKLAGQEGFVGLRNDILNNSTPSAPVAVAKIAEFATARKIDAAKLESCIKAGETKSIYTANWAEFKTFTNSPGTPGNVVINNETGEWKLIAGAYPVETFKQVISGFIGTAK